MNVTAFSGSPRKNGNSTILMQEFINSLTENGADCNTYDATKININPCSGCLRCNVTRICSQKNDAWQTVADEILACDVLVFASPVYFHHLTSDLKKIIDRFRSFIRVKITPEGLKEEAHRPWAKHFVLFLTLGSSNNEDAQPIIDLFNFMLHILGPENKLHVFTANRCVVPGQIIGKPERNSILYQRLGLPAKLAFEDHQKNQALLQEIYKLGKELSLQK